MKTRLAFTPNMYKPLDIVIRLQMLEAVAEVPFQTWSGGQINERRGMALAQKFFSQNPNNIDPSFFSMQEQGISRLLWKTASKVLKFEDDDVKSDVIIAMITGSKSNQPITIDDMDINFRVKKAYKITLRLKEGIGYQLGNHFRDQIFNGKMKLQTLKHMMSKFVFRRALDIWKKIINQEKRMVRLDNNPDFDTDDQVNQIFKEQVYDSPMSRSRFTGIGDFAWSLIDDGSSKLGKKLRDAFTEAFLFNTAFYLKKNGQLKDYALAGMLWWQYMLKHGASFSHQRNQDTALQYVIGKMKHQGINVDSANLVRGLSQFKFQNLFNKRRRFSPNAGYLYKALVLAGRYVRFKHRKLIDELENQWALYSGPYLGSKLARKRMVQKIARKWLKKNHKPTFEYI